MALSSPYYEQKRSVDTLIKKGFEAQSRSIMERWWNTMVNRSKSNTTISENDNGESNTECNNNHTIENHASQKKKKEKKIKRTTKIRQVFVKHFLSVLKRNLYHS